MAKQAKQSFKADDIVKKPEIIDSHQQAFLMVWEWSADSSGEVTAQAMNILARKGWVFHHMAASPGGGFSGKQIVLFSVYRRQRKRE